MSEMTGADFRRWRRARELSQADVMSLFHVRSSTTVAKWEAGRTKPVPMRIALLCDAISKGYRPAGCTLNLDVL